MCRYAQYGPYKVHYACFSCRKAFKQPPIEDWMTTRDRGYVYKELQRLWSFGPGLELRENELGIRLADLEAEYRSATHNCPECDSPMIDMGLDFKPPRQSDHKAWRRLHGMYRVGHKFHTCGCDGPGFIPQSNAEYRLYLQEQKTQFSEQIRSAEQSSELCAERKRETVNFWVSRIHSIDDELSKL